MLPFDKHHGGTIHENHLRKTTHLGGAVHERYTVWPTVYLRQHDWQWSTGHSEDHINNFVMKKLLHGWNNMCTLSTTKDKPSWWWQCYAGGVDIWSDSPVSDNVSIDPRIQGQTDGSNIKAIHLLIWDDGVFHAAVAMTDRRPALEIAPMTFPMIIQSACFIWPMPPFYKQLPGSLKWYRAFQWANDGSIFPLKCNDWICWEPT